MQTAMDNSYFFSQHVVVNRHTRYLLPHWQQGQVWCFVTWHLADSIPADVLLRWQDEKETWRRLHPEPWDEETAKEYRRRISSRMEEWLDQGSGSCLLRDKDNAQIVARALRHFDGERHVLAAFVVMPNHVHALFRPCGGHLISDIMKSWKWFTAREINKRMNASGSLWQAEFRDRLIRNEAHFHSCLRYIRQNPAKANLRDGFVAWSADL